MMPSATLIVATAQNGVIGRDNDMPWRQSEDLKYFKKNTLGKTLLMGRKTFDSIGKPLPGRDTIVLSRHVNHIDGCQVIEAITQLDEVLTPDADLMVVGGAQLYRLMLPHCDTILRTEIHAEIEGDTFFPELSPDEWCEISRESHPADAYNQYAYDFVVLERTSIDQ